MRNQLLNYSGADSKAKLMTVSTTSLHLCGSKNGIQSHVQTAKQEQTQAEARSNLSGCDTCHLLDPREKGHACAGTSCRDLGQVTGCLHVGRSSPPCLGLLQRLLTLQSRRPAQRACGMLLWLPHCRGALHGSKNPYHLTLESQAVLSTPGQGIGCKGLGCCWQPLAALPGVPL